ncbi:MAG: CARDB domain-containing protein, partial [Cyanobium sp.]
GFFDTDPTTGRVTIPAEGAHLHLHGCSADLRHGGHLHHEHPGTKLLRLERLSLYPLQQLNQLVSDLAVVNLCWKEGCAEFTVVNQGRLDVSDLGVAVVVDDCYSSHSYLRLPWLEAGAAEHFSVPLSLASGHHQLEVIADPEQDILENPVMQANNRAALELHIP